MLKNKKILPLITGTTLAVGTLSSTVGCSLVFGDYYKLTAVRQMLDGLVGVQNKINPEWKLTKGGKSDSKRFTFEKEVKLISGKLPTGIECDVNTGEISWPANPEPVSGTFSVKCHVDGSIIDSEPITVGIQKAGAEFVDVTYKYQNADSRVKTVKTAKGGPAYEPLEPMWDYTKWDYKHKFLYWRLEDENEPYDFTSNVNSSIVLVAEWTTIKAEIESIYVKSVPTQIQYVIGEPFQSAGMEVYAIFTDKDERKLETTEYEYEQPSTDQKGVKEVKVWLKGDKSISTSFNIYVGFDTPETYYYSVTYQYIKGSSSESTVDVLKNTVPKKPYDPKRIEIDSSTGEIIKYQFDGWFYQEGSSEPQLWDFNPTTGDVVTKNIVLYAGWTQLSGNDPAKIYISSVPKHDFFTGDDFVTTDLEVKIVQSNTIEKTAVIGDDVIIDSSAVKKDEVGTYPVDIKINPEKYPTAKVASVTYYVAYNQGYHLLTLNPGYDSLEPMKYYVVDNSKDEPTISRPGYDFAGWYDDDTGEKIDFSAGVKRDIFATAHWISKSMIKWRANLGQGLKEYKISLDDLCNPQAETIHYAPIEQDQYSETIARSTFGNNLQQTIIIGSDVSTIPNHFLEECNNFIAPIEFEENSKVSLIGQYFMNGCSKFNSPITIPDSVSVIGRSFMEGCTTFNNSLHLSENLFTLGSRFLADCTNFANDIVIPGGVDTIGTQFMLDCKSMYSLSLDSPKINIYCTMGSFSASGTESMSFALDKSKITPTTGSVINLVVTSQDDINTIQWNFGNVTEDTSTIYRSINPSIRQQ